MPASEPKRGLFVFAVGTQQPAAERGRVVRTPRRRTLVGDHDLAALEHALEQFCRNDALGRIRWCELEADRQAVGCAEQVEAEAPEPAAVRAAVAVAADPGQCRAADGLAGGGAGHRGGIEQPQPIADRRRQPCEHGDRLQQLRCQAAKPLVEARLAGDVGEQVPEPLLGKPQEASLVRAIEQHLRDRQTDQLAVGDPQRTPEAPSRQQEIIDQRVNADQQSSRGRWTRSPPWSTVMDTAD